MNKLLKNKSEIYTIFNRIKKRDFKGYTGLAIKNSIYALSTNFVSKITSFLFVIILARILMPELFGLYSLALATILLFIGFSELGIGQTFIKFISNELGKKKIRKAKAYAYYLLKVKIVIVVITAVALILLAKFISHTYYNKPIFLALIAGSLYIIFAGIVNIMHFFFQSVNDFKTLFFKEIFFQVLRIILVPLIILYSLKYISSPETVIFMIILGISCAWLLTFFFLMFFIRKKVPFLKIKKSKLSIKEKKTVRNFILQLMALSLSGLFFAQIDMLFLGRFVLSTFIGHYAVAISLVGSLGPLIAFSGVFLPIFSRLRGKRLEKSFKKSIKMTFLISLSIFILTLVFATLFINIFYGGEYANSIPLLRILSPLIISMPLISMYTVYFIAKGNPKIVTKGLIISTLFNIVLNYLLIVWLINYSQIAAVFGICIATLISRYLYLGILIRNRKVNLNKKLIP
jgi:O-antigen/teichoic acid export membrane protein